MGDLDKGACLGVCESDDFSDEDKRRRQDLQEQVSLPPVFPSTTNPFCQSGSDAKKTKSCGCIGAVVEGRDRRCMGDRPTATSQTWAKKTILFSLTAPISFETTPLDSNLTPVGVDVGSDDGVSGGSLVAGSSNTERSGWISVFPRLGPIRLWLRTCCCTCVYPIGP